MMRSSSSFICFLLAVVGHQTRGDDEQQQQQQLQQLQLLSKVTSDFSQRLYKEIALNEPNVVYSPYSIHSALTMTYMGARGETANEMSKTLGLTSFTDSSPHQTYHDLIVQMNSVQGVKLHTANGLFINPKMQVEPDFVHQATENYLASIANLDMTAEGGPEQAVNDYVENKTENMIKDILSPGSIDASTVMVLVNTIFFNGTWENKFTLYKTRKQDFHQLNGVKSQVDMMNKDMFVNIKNDNSNGVDVLELPFTGRRCGLYIALPQKVEGITELEKMLSQPSNVDQLFEGLTPKMVQVSIPKFKVETTVTLNSVLKSLGMIKAFDPFSADFSGISHTGNVYISEVIHKAMIDVQETGTVAAAATAIGLKSMSVMISPIQFVADHPFVFFLRDNQTKQILFQGKFSG